MNKIRERRLVERDSQEELVLKINQLAYQINRAGIAEGRKMIATKIAQRLLEETASSLVDASEETKRALVSMYLRMHDWDLDVVFNLREFRDGTGLGMTWQQIVENEIYSMAEEAFGIQIDVELNRLRAEREAA